MPACSYKIERAVSGIHEKGMLVHNEAIDQCLSTKVSAINATFRVE